MARLSGINDFNELGLLYQVDEMINEYSRLKNEFLFDSRAEEIFSWSINHLKKLRVAIEREIRFEYLEIQKKIDSMYKLDKQITGVMLLLDFKDAETPNRGILHFQINK